MTKVLLKNHRQAPRKVRLIADMIRGKKVENALSELKFTTKRASGVIKKLLESAVANAKNNEGKNKENLYIKEIQVNEGPVMKRMLPMSKGRAFVMKKRTSKITLELADIEDKTNKKAKKQVEKKPVIKKVEEKKDK